LEVVVKQDGKGIHCAVFCCNSVLPVIPQEFCSILGVKGQDWVLRQVVFVPFQPGPCVSQIALVVMVGALGFLCVS
jgi:hypothetical protein